MSLCPSPFGVKAFGIIIGAQSQTTTFTGILFETAVAFVTQGRLLVSTQLITSPLFILDGLNTALFVPAFAPFTFH